MNALQVKVQHQEDYQEALKGELKSYLLKRKGSIIRNAEDNVRDMETSNLIFVFSKFNCLVCLCELR